jgi:hypothetical protein
MLSQGRFQARLLDFLTDRPQQYKRRSSIGQAGHQPARLLLSTRHPASGYMQSFPFRHNPKAKKSAERARPSTPAST